MAFLIFFMSALRMVVTLIHLLKVSAQIVLFQMKAN